MAIFGAIGGCLLPPRQHEYLLAPMIWSDLEHFQAMKTVQTMEPMQRVQTEWKWMYHGLEPDLDLQSLLHHCIVIPISFRCHSDIISMSFRCHSGVVPLSFQCHFIARDMTKFWQWNDPETKSSLDLGSFYFRTTGNEKRPRSRERQERSRNDPH